MNVLASLIVLGLLIFFHESGHFLAARFQGIRVNGFSIGFGPALIKKELNKIYKKLYFKNETFVHRDFHVSNLMIKNKKLCIKWSFYCSNNVVFCSSL